MAAQESNPLYAIVEMLSDGRFHSGDSIKQQLGITPNTVLQTIKKIRHYGVNIDESLQQGYRLTEPLQLLSQEKIVHCLSGWGIALEIFETTDSTNSYLLNHTLSPLSPSDAIQVCIAEQQTQGRGRHASRLWQAPFAQNICFSLRYQFNRNVNEVGGLSAVVALAVVRALQNYPLGVSGLGIKWPNDIFCHGKKLAGILIENRIQSHDRVQTVIGVGLNVNMMSHHAKSITQPWTSLRQESGHYIDRNQLCADLIKQLLIYLDRFVKSGLSDFMIEWQQYDVLSNRPLSLEWQNRCFTGIAKGIDSQGRLQLLLSDGSMESFSSAETRLCKK